MYQKAKVVEQADSILIGKYCRMTNVDLLRKELGIGASVFRTGLGDSQLSERQLSPAGCVGVMVHRFFMTPLRGLRASDKAPPIGLEP